MSRPRENKQSNVMNVGGVTTASAGGSMSRCIRLTSFSSNTPTSPSRISVVLLLVDPAVATERLGEDGLDEVEARLHPGGSVPELDRAMAEDGARRASGEPHPPQPPSPDHAMPDINGRSQAAPHGAHAKRVARAGRAHAADVEENEPGVGRGVDGRGSGPVVRRRGWAERGIDRGVEMPVSY